MRLDLSILNKGIVATRSQGSDLIRRGKVLVNGKIVTKCGYEVLESDEIAIDEVVNYFSRGYKKLEGAVQDFGISFGNKTVLDVGSSTGGFTYYALTHGAQKVICYDTGKDQMHPSIRNDERVELHEETNILSTKDIQVDIVLIDVSFVSVLPILKHVISFGQQILFLIKPQFEIGKQHIKNGIVKDKNLIDSILLSIQEEITLLGSKIHYLKPCHIKGKGGNNEFFCLIDGKA